MEPNCRICDFILKQLEHSIIFVRIYGWKTVTMTNLSTKVTNGKEVYVKINIISYKSIVVYITKILTTEILPPLYIEKL